jgi:hypothetical protein
MLGNRIIRRGKKVRPVLRMKKSARSFRGVLGIRSWLAASCDDGDVPGIGNQADGLGSRSPEPQVVSLHCP